jgi:IclR family acetate operon transcriptional repressor
MTRAAPAGPRRVESVQRAVAVLDAVAEENGEIGTNELARRTGINASSVSRLLATLVDARLVEHVPATGRYRLGVRLLQLGTAVIAGLDVRRLARPLLERLVETTGETATLSLPADDSAVTVDFVRSPASVQSVTTIGRPSVGHATAAGKVVLAFCGAEVGRASLHRFTPRTITDRAELERELGRVRRRGWAEAVGEREQDLNAVAAPVRGVGGDVEAVLGIQGPEGRFDPAAMRAARTALVEAAAELSAALGWTSS